LRSNSLGTEDESLKCNEINQGMIEGRLAIQSTPKQYISITPKAGR